MLVPDMAAGAARSPTLWWEPTPARFWSVNQGAIERLFDNGQCTQWAAYWGPAVVQQIVERWVGYEIRHHRPEALPNMDARYWITEARDIGIRVEARPRAGSLVVYQPGVLGAGAAGHIAYVIQVYRPFFLVSEMNAPRRYRVTYARVPRWVATLPGVRFIWL
jgi:CHAP domain